MRIHRLLKALACGWAFASVAAVSLAAAADDPRGAAASDPGPHPYTPKIAGASDEATRAIRTFRVPQGLRVELFAAEPLLANPVAFCLDEKGVMYVAETFRLHAGVTDTRGHMNWLDDDLASRTVADRVAMYRKYLGAEFAKYSLEHDRVRRLVDRDGDGRADGSTVFADGFNDPAAGIGAGVLARKGDVWYACIPWLWKLRDNDGDGRADRRELLHQGYGVHVGFLGHDLHGLRFGPDGKLYFSIGDRGFNVTTLDNRKLSVPDTGSVLRCNPDGTELEVFATGLRNPQELAFDEFGNLFTGDNNSDSGDKARWVYVVEGGDSGWRIGYQFIAGPVSRGPWNEEKLWHPAFDGQAAYIVPPIANIADGPSGLAYDPGDQPAARGVPQALLPGRLPRRQRPERHPELRDAAQGGVVRAGGCRRSSSGRRWPPTSTSVPTAPCISATGSRAGRSRTRGGSTACSTRPGNPIPGFQKSARCSRRGWTLARTTSWRGCWPTRTCGSARRRSSPWPRGEKPGSAVAGEGTAERIADPVVVTGPSDGQGALKGLAQVAAAPSGDLLARLHAIWGLGQVGRVRSRRRSGSSTWDVLGPLLDDRQAEVRAQAAKVLGEVREAKAFDGLIARLRDDSPRVRSLAAIALGKLGRAGGGRRRCWRC